MAALVREFPDLRVTFNLVPSLLVQLEAFAHDDARDRHLELGLAPGPRPRARGRALLPGRVLSRAPRPHGGAARALCASCSSGGSRHGPAGRRSPSTNCAICRCGTSWCGSIRSTASRPANRARCPRRAAASQKPTRPSLREVEIEILRRVVPEYREASERGQAELSTSPFYHPILPLLCDVGVYGATHPDWPPPEEPFRYPGDALDQLERSVELHTRLFGDTPGGPVAVRRRRVRRDGPAWCNGPGFRGWPPTRRSSGTRSD